MKFFICSSQKYVIASYKAITNVASYDNIVSCNNITTGRNIFTSKEDSYCNLYTFNDFTAYPFLSASKHIFT